MKKIKQTFISRKYIILLIVSVLILGAILTGLALTFDNSERAQSDNQAAEQSAIHVSPTLFSTERGDLRSESAIEALTLIHPEGSFKDLTMDIPKDWRQEFTDGVNQILILSKGSVELEIVRGNIEGYECIASDKSARQGVFGLEYNQSEVEVMNTEIGEIFLIPNPRTIEAEVSDYYVCTSAPSDKGDFDWTLTDYGVFSISVKNNGSNDDYLDALEIIQSFR